MPWILLPLHSFDVCHASAGPMMECWTASELVMLLNAVAVCSRSLCIPLFPFPTDAAWRLRAPMASRLYNSLDDVPLCMRSTHAVRVRYSDNYTDVPLCLPNPTPSFQVQTMTPRSRRLTMPAHLQTTPISQYTREHIAMLHHWADCPASQLLTDNAFSILPASV